MTEIEMHVASARSSLRDRTAESIRVPWWYFDPDITAPEIAVGDVGVLSDLSMRNIMARIVLWEIEKC